jgi:hypothetical protein
MVWHDWPAKAGNARASSNEESTRGGSFSLDATGVEPSVAMGHERYRLGSMDAPGDGRTGRQGSSLDNLDGIATAVTGYQATQLIGVFVALRLGELTQDGPRTAADLADATGTDARLLVHCLDALCDLGLLAASGSGYARGGLGTVFDRDEVASFEGLILHNATIGYSSWGRLLDALRSRHVEPASMYELPDAPSTFDEGNDAMATAQRAPVVAGCFAWDAVRTVVDVGGGLGGVLVRLLADHPHLRATLVETPRVASQVTRRVAGSGVEDRLEVRAGSFFDALPSEDDVYLLVHVLLNWPDHKALDVLRTCRAAMRDDSRLLVVEPVIRLSDPNPRLAISTHLLCGGQLRDVREHVRLLTAAGLRLTRAVRAGPEAVLEAAPAA